MLIVSRHIFVDSVLESLEGQSLMVSASSAVVVIEAVLSAALRNANILIHIITNFNSFPQKIFFERRYPGSSIFVFDFE